MRHKCKCIKSYGYTYPYEKGEWYTYAHNNPIFYVYFEDGDNSHRAFYDREFEKYFLTVEEVRELEIDKVLNDEVSL